MTRHLILAGALLCCAGCFAQHPELQTRVQTVEVRTPVRAPCPDIADVPALPRRVAAEHPTMPRLPDGSEDWHAISRILGAKVLELFGYADRADALLQNCSRPD